MFNKINGMQMRIILLLLLIIFPATGPAFGGISAKAEVSSEKHIVIMHPTVANLQTWLYLVSEGILPVDPGSSYSILAPQILQKFASGS